MSKPRSLMLLLSLLLLGYTSRTEAESPEGLVGPVYQVLSPNFLNWEADSQALHIEGTGGSEYPVIYSLPDQTVTPADQSLPTEIAQTLYTHPRAPLEQDVKVYLSPDQRFAVYDSLVDDNDYLNVVLVDVVGGELVSFERLQPQSDLTRFSFEVVWSANSAAFYVKMNFSSFVSYHYVTGFAENLANAQVTRLTGDEEFGGLVKGHVQWVNDIDQTGRFLLIEADQYLDPNPLGSLLVMDMMDLSYKVITHEYKPRSSNFERSNSGAVNYLSGNSIYVYDRTSETSQLRLADVGFQPRSIDEVEFSPDGRYAAIAVVVADFTDVIYILEIEPTSQPENCDAPC